MAVRARLFGFLPFLRRRPPTVCRFSSSTTPAAVSPPPPPPPAAAYVHLPFCRKRCHYCDFPVVALGSSPSFAGGIDPRISDYVAVLLREISATTTTGPGDGSAGLETIYFGGGTPSLVPPVLISSILNALDFKFGIAAHPEISIEMDPGTFDGRRLEDLADLGVNRVSLGVQAFQDELLKACGRAHGLREVYDAVETVAGCRRISNWSIDLISSLPHQTPEMWEESLRLAVEASPTHISVYDLQVEPGTKFSQLYLPGEAPLPSDDQSASFYESALETLRSSGYGHYEISSYCKEGYECKHNLTYWNNKPFYGFGLGSASFVNGARFSRPRRMKGYADYVKGLEEGRREELGGGEPAPATEAAKDAVMLSLRTARGLDVRSFAVAFGDPMAAALCGALGKHAESGLVVAMDGRGKALTVAELGSPAASAVGGVRGIAFIRLSDPEGFLLSNELIAVAFNAISK